jgi:catechol 2,3-dioxygenase-like lactoylglutathione lyase family enzyme
MAYRILRASALQLCILAAMASLGCGSGDAEKERESLISRPDTSAGPLPILATNAFYYYRDVNGARDFYTGLLGFETVADYGFAKMLRVGPSSYLTLVEEERGMHSSEEPKSVTLAVVTEEVEGWWEYLSAAGVDMRADLDPGDGRPHDGFVARDPEGYLLEFERFNDHPENRDLLPVLAARPALYPDGSETAQGVSTRRPAGLGVQGTVLWLYYRDLEAIQAFYRRLLGTDLLVDQGWARIFPVAGTGFLGLVDGSRGLHRATEEKAVTVSFLTDDIQEWHQWVRDVQGFQLREPGIGSEGDFVRTFVGYDPEGYYLEWDQFLDVPVNVKLLSSMQGRSVQD